LLWKRKTKTAFFTKGGAEKLLKRFTYSFFLCQIPTPKPFTLKIGKAASQKSALKPRDKLWPNFLMKSYTPLLPLLRAHYSVLKIRNDKGQRVLSSYGNIFIVAIQLFKHGGARFKAM